MSPIIESAFDDFPATYFTYPNFVSTLLYDRRPVDGVLEKSPFRDSIVHAYQVEGRKDTA